MVPRPTRRMLLRALGTAGTVAVAGCSELPTDRGTTAAERTPTVTPAESSPSDPTTTDSETRSPTATPTPEPRTDDFYIENYDEKKHCISVSLTHQGTTIIDGSYTLDARQGARFEDVGDEGNVYTVRASLDGGETEEFEWAVDGCPSEYPGDRNGGVVVQDGSLEFWANECDAIYVGYELGHLIGPTDDGCDT